MLYAADTIRTQIDAILAAWGMAEEPRRASAEVMVETDLRGVDSHGISMLPMYDEMRRQGKLRMAPEVRTLRETPTTALIDAGAGLGHHPSRLAMGLAVEKARGVGVAVVGVANSHHFGAAGIYAEIAAAAGLIGMVTCSTRYVSVVPTFAAVPVLGTNPIAFAAPAGCNPPFVLDMATSTVAAGKVKVHKLQGWPLPEGWVVDGAGKAVTDAALGFDIIFNRPEGGLTPVGGSRESGSHKGYGLALMGHILGGALMGGSFSPLRNRTQKPADPDNIGHFFLAIDPAAFRERGAFEADLDDVIDTLHAAPRADPEQPVLVAGDPEREARAERLRDGIPLPDSLIAQIKAIAAGSGAPFLLGA